jgi:uncharacterized RDD family membrane protein YckC
MQNSIEITTTQNVTIEYELAPLRERMLGWVLDLAIVLFVFFALIILFRSVAGPDLLGDMTWIVLWGSLPWFYFLYNIFFEIWNFGQTPGKKAMNMKVVRLDGQDPEWSDVILRSLLHLVDTIFSAGVIGALLIKTTPKAQRLGDMAANTTVIKVYNTRFNFRLEDILSISSLQNYQPVFPQVRHLAERDMIFIKNVLSRYQQYPNNAHHEVVENLVTHLMPILQLQQRPNDRVEFLKTLLRDYIVLTR